MSFHSNWNLMYVVGNPDTMSMVTTDAESPMKRSLALDAAKRLATNSWRVWVEHKDSGERIFESDVEKNWAKVKEAQTPDFTLTFSDAISQLMSSGKLVQGDRFKPGTYIGLLDDVAVLMTKGKRFPGPNLLLSKSLLTQSFRTFLVPAEAV